MKGESKDVHGYEGEKPVESQIVLGMWGPLHDRNQLSEQVVGGDCNGMGKKGGGLATFPLRDVVNNSKVVVREETRCR